MDGVGELRSGERFSDPIELKKVLLTRQETFARGLTEKLLTYAAGRSMTFREQSELETIAEQAIQPGRGFRDMILEVATSEVFTNR